MVIETSKIELVDLRLYRKGLGVEVDDLMPKALVYYDEKDNKYHNVIVPEETYPLMRRMPYANTTLSGVDFGTKLSIDDQNQIEEIGICAIVCNDSFMDEIRKQTYIYVEDIEEKMLYSKLYFKDRIRIIERRINEGIKVPKKLKKMVSEDYESNCYYQDQIFCIRDTKKQLRKK